MHLKTTWQDTPKSIRIICYTLIPLGVACGTVGIYGDWNGWWYERGFLTNLMSSFTGLLFGIPVALAVISHLGSTQAEAIERRAVRRQASLAAADFQRMVRSPFSSSVQNPESSLRSLAEKARRLELKAQELRDALAPGSSKRGREESDKALIRDALESLVAFCSACEDSLEFSGETDETIWSVLVASQWRVLDSEIRPRATDVGLSWLPSEKSFRIGHSVAVVQQASWITVQKNLQATIRHIKEAIDSGENYVWNYQDKYVPILADARAALEESAQQARNWLLKLADLVEWLGDIRTIESPHP
ncbi:hypothetical protein AB4225_35165 [Streptomyces sp. 2RAF24]|uniref:hypothetical protein n=1 Tax=unclassified Streptomyces TaxID=2593676 RepID=UPI0033E1D4CC